VLAPALKHARLRLRLTVINIMHIEQTFFVARPPEVVFDYVTNPAKLSSWQTANRSVEPLTSGPPGVGSRFREHTKPPLGNEFEQRASSPGS